MKCSQILEKVFSYDMEGDTATQASVVDGFFITWLVFFFLCPFVFSRKVCELMHPKKGHVYVHFPPTSMNYNM